MDLYLDSNATTTVLPSALRAAQAAMADDFGNPSSTHSAGLRARALLDRTRATARRVMGAPTGKIVFNSGATEGVHTAVLSALSSLRSRFPNVETRPSLLLYGATEHKAVPEALKHWNGLLGLQLQMLAIPVGRDGRHDLRWLADHAKRAALVCTMAANNETGVISDLPGIARALQGSPALWLVDSVQALGKLALRLDELPIDYAPCSGHKLFAPKGVGMLYVREGAPFTPLLTGGGQEGGLRAGTENVAGIAALGAVLSAIEDGASLRSSAQLAEDRGRLLMALREAFPGLALNAPLDGCLPTTLNFSVPGLSSRLLLDLFDAAGVCVSGGSACSASKAEPSDVLEAMGLPPWQALAAVRLSFDATVSDEMIDAACARIRACGESLRRNGLMPNEGECCAPPELIARFTVDGACSGRCVDEERVEMDRDGLRALAAEGLQPLFVDVREAFEQQLGPKPAFLLNADHQALPISSLLNALPPWLAQESRPVVFFCRSGNRSAQAARALRRSGHVRAWSLQGGLALWRDAEAQTSTPLPARVHP